MDERVIEFIEGSKQGLFSKKSYLESVEISVTEYLNNSIINTSTLKNVSVNSRIKDANSLGEKIIRKKALSEFSDPEDFIDSLKDIIGIRLVCLLNEDEGLLFEEIVSVFSMVDDIHNDFYSITGVNKQEGYLLINHNDQPDTQKNGKKIYKMDCLWVDGDNVTHLELQIKSLVHMFWGELEHKLIYKNYTYDEHQGFYSDIMDSIEDMLSNIDKQLFTINHHLKNKGKREQKIRMREMLSTEMFINLQDKLNNQLINYDVDFREVYILLAQLLLLGKTYTAIVRDLSGYMRDLAGISILAEDFQFNKNDLVIDTEIHLKEFSETVSELILSEDIFWRVLFGLYYLVKQDETVKATYKDFVEKLTGIFLTEIQEKYTELHQLEHPELVQKVIVPSILNGIVYSFNKYKKMIFFIDGKQKENIVKVIEDHIDSLVEQIENYSCDEFEQAETTLNKILSDKLRIQILLGINFKIPKEEIKDLVLALQTNSYWVFELDFDSIGKC